MTELAGRTALVTGEAAGIGLATAHVLAASGATVIIGDDAAHGLERLTQYLDILITLPMPGPVSLTVDQSEEGFGRAYAANVSGLRTLIAAAIPTLIGNRGAVVNVTSAGGATTSTDSACAAAVAELTRTWAVQFGPSDVRFNSVAPGLGAVDPADVAEAIVFLASPRAGYITGTTLCVNGAASAV